MPAGDPYWITNTFVNPNVWHQSVNSNVWYPSPFVTHNINSNYFKSVEFSFTKKTYQVQETFTFIDFNETRERRLAERWTVCHEDDELYRPIHPSETAIEENIDWKAEGF